MANERQIMYDGFSGTGKYSAEWVWITKEFLNLAFVGDCCEASCPCSRCENRRILSKYEIYAHLAKKGFMSKYLLWHQHGEVQPAVANKSDGNDDFDRMDDMVANIGRGYDLESKDPSPEVQNFYRLLIASEEKVHDGTVLQVVTRLMAFKSKYNFSNQCYNDIVKLIIDLIPSKHNIPKDLYQSKNIVSDLIMNYEKIDACKKMHIVLEGVHEGDKRRWTIYHHKVVVKQLHYIPITSRLKWLFLCEETVQQMRWHKKGIRDSEDVDIVSHPTDAEA
jgi:hypothetical protein